ncbi:MAG: IS66 family transposase, partial [Candidatus Binatia bacterium]
MTVEEQAAAFGQPDIVALLRRNAALQEQNAALTRQVAWFKRQLFGRKSERRLLPPDARQLALSGFGPPGDDPTDTPPPPTETVRAYQRRVQHTAAAEAGDARELRFDATVPMEVIQVPNPEAA